MGRIDVPLVVDQRVRRTDQIEFFGKTQDVAFRAAVKEDLGAGLQKAVFRVMGSIGVIEDDIDIGVPGLGRQLVAEMDVGPCDRVKTQDGVGVRLLRGVVVARCSWSFSFFGGAPGCRTRGCRDPQPLGRTFQPHESKIRAPSSARQYGNIKNSFFLTFFSICLYIPHDRKEPT